MVSKSSKTIKSKERLFNPPKEESTLLLENSPGKIQGASSSMKEAENVSMLMAACQQGLPHDVLMYIKKKVRSTRAAGSSFIFDRIICRGLNN